eukprot:CAMPEP_0181323152 /NCGR_PEP_ID=MMETSP1101-20121128/19623_1 /TAXON_ID=46948 /ORGANISM="Rhodomonas abbreviata, Strain Caron Lab Isolate" /LENGTH=59 /DNA_ID=CAMNT_0023431141 /DNA_START=15 /DNA_END=194 /DNA_ORIENTATION=-
MFTQLPIIHVLFPHSLQQVGSEYMGGVGVGGTQMCEVENGKCVAPWLDGEVCECAAAVP